MKRYLICLLILLVLIIGISVNTLAFPYITLLQTDSDLVMYFDGFYGTWFFLSGWGVGGIIEKRLFLDRLFFGAGVYFTGVTLDYSYYSTSTTATASYMGLNFAFYAKYFIFTPKESKKMFNFPLILGVAGGASYSLWFSTINVSSTTYSYGQVDPVRILAVGIVGYQVDWFMKGTKLSVSLGIVDNTFGYYVDFWLPSGKNSYFHLYWVPLIGIGVSYLIEL